jgi:hypothetical protein
MKIAQYSALDLRNLGASSNQSMGVGRRGR